MAEFAERVFAPLWPALEKRGTRVVCNAGGMNPEGLRDHLLRIAAQKGWRVRVAAVCGDDVTPQLAGWLAEGALQPFELIGQPETLPPAGEPHRPPHTA